MTAGTARTKLTLLTEADLPAMLDLAKEPDTFKYLEKLRIMNDAEYEQYVHGKLEQIRNKTGYHWAVWRKEDGSFIGAINLNPVRGTSMMQIGCQLKRETWGKGYASELMQWVLDYAIREASLRVVYGLFERDNVVSKKLLERLGFSWKETRSEGTVRVEVYEFKV